MPGEKHRQPERKRQEKEEYNKERREFLKYLLGFGLTSTLTLGGLFLLLKNLPKKERRKFILKEIIKKRQENINKIEKISKFNPNEKIKVEINSELKKFLKETKISGLIEYYFPETIDDKISPRLILDNL
ncbi:MAG: hypothetical protein KatS3mg094_108 [Candidatus Parcubacteria bacterium]|nr:MAG: hypothetical protein KatS3mg094_108 [Candidatus Parcubacteria bacterium]